LKRCISIERSWNRNEVSRESPAKELNRRPTSLKKFRADAFSGPMVSKAWIGIYNQIIIIIMLCNTKRYKNQAVMNLTPPPPSQNSHAVRWHCTAESERTTTTTTTTV